jgi:hypothetical protein
MKSGNKKINKYSLMEIGLLIVIIGIMLLFLFII